MGGAVVLPTWMLPLDDWNEMLMDRLYETIVENYHVSYFKIVIIIIIYFYSFLDK